MTNRKIYSLIAATVWSVPALSSTVPIVGDVGQAGGVVFYVDTASGMAYESSLADQSPAFPVGQFWGCEGTLIGTSTAVGAGKANTDAIMAAGCAGSGTAASLASNFSQGGYDDWFLPSKGELDLMRNNLALLSLDYDHYHYSSSEYTNAIASVPEFNSYCVTSNNCVWVWEDNVWFKTYTSPSGERVGVRAIRSYEYQPSPVPLPGTLALLGIGLAGLGFVRRKAKP